jgi:hypothetical protein
MHFMPVWGFSALVLSTKILVGQTTNIVPGGGV